MIENLALLKIKVLDILGVGSLMVGKLVLLVAGDQIYWPQQRLIGYSHYHFYQLSHNLVSHYNFHHSKLRPTI